MFPYFGESDEASRPNRFNWTPTHYLPRKKTTGWSLWTHRPVNLNKHPLPEPLWASLRSLELGPYQVIWLLMVRFVCTNITYEFARIIYDKWPLWTGLQDALNHQNLSSSLTLRTSPNVAVLLKSAAATTSPVARLTRRLSGSKCQYWWERPLT